MRRLHVSLLTISLLCLACSSRPQFVSTQIGRTINTDGTVGDGTTVFAPDDTVYLSVATAGPGSATMRARWTYAGRLVDESTKRVSYRGDAATEFHLKPPDPFPPGDYSVEIFFDGQSVGTTAFRVVER
ncbi:MAG TPA: hypothetical protein VGF24_16155 [Vicinamibacterales bacterium]|jgi:hypothetical protein